MGKQVCLNGGITVLSHCHIPPVQNPQVNEQFCFMKTAFLVHSPRELQALQDTLVSTQPAMFEGEA